MAIRLSRSARIVETGESDAPPGASFGALLKHYRIAAGLSQEALAERARLSARAISALEQGVRLAPYRDTVALLVRALGLLPSDAAALEAAVPRRRGPPGHTTRPAPQGPLAQAQPARPRPPAARGTGLPPLVGRARELGLLERHLAGEGPPLLLLAGEPGVGKTRLAQEVLRRAGERGVRALVGRCYEQHASLPFSPFVEALSAAMALASPALRQEAPRRFPYLERLLPDFQAGPPAHESNEARFQVLYAVAGFLRALAAEGPLALLLDDLHWADSASLDLLLYLARQAAGTPMLLLGTYRDVEVNRQHPLEATLGDLVREQLAEEIHLQCLPPSGTAALIGTLVGTQEIPPELPAMVHERTGGNPLFTKEVLKDLVEQGALARDTVTRIDAPHSIRAAVGRRVGRLPEGAQEVLRVASILGQEFDLEVLLAAAGQDEETLLGHLDALLALRLLEERRAGRGERYTFSHALVGQALYEEIPRHRVRKLHLRAAEALERHSGDRLQAAAELARHFLVAGENARAIPCMRQAGDYAAGLYAHAEAVKHYEAALELLGDTADVPGVARLREKLGTELRLLGRYDAALAVLDQSAQAWRTAGDLERLGQVLAEIGWVYASKGEPDVGVRRLQDALPLLDAQGPSASLAALYESLAWLAFTSGRYTEYLTTSERATGLARVVGDSRMVARMHMHRGNALQMLGHVEEALQVTEQAIVQTKEIDALVHLSAAWTNKAFIHVQRGEFDAAERAWRQAAEIYERLGDQMFNTLFATWSSAPLFFQGKWDQVLTILEQAHARTKQEGESFASPYVRLFLGRLCLVRGEWSDAAHHLDDAVAAATRIGDLQAQRWAAGSRAELAVLEGRPAAACDLLGLFLDRPGLEEFDVTLFLPVLAWAYLDLGDVAQADHTAKAAVRRARAERLRVVLVDALRVQALVACRQGRGSAAEAALEEGLALARAMPYPYAEGRLLHVYGEKHILEGEPGPGRECLGAALTIFRRLGARKDIIGTEQLLATLD